MRKTLSSIYFLVGIYLSLAYLTFGLLPLAFFQQDEWAIIGTYLYFDKAGLGWLERLFTYGQGTHTIPLSGLLSMVEYKLFNLNFSPYAYTSIIMHLLNTGLVFYLAYLFFKKKLPAFIAGFVFLVDSIPSQGITWIATTSSTAGTTTFVLFSLIFLARFLLNRSNNLYIALSFISLFASLLFKESAVFMFLFLPIFWLAFDYKKNYMRKARYLIGIFFVGILYALPRLWLMFFNSSSAVSASEGLAYPSLPVYIYRAMTLPLKAITQSIIPADQIIAVAEQLVSYGYPNLSQIGISNIFIAQTIGADTISYLFASIIILVCIFFYKKARSGNMVINSKLIIISLVFIALSSLPLIFVPGKPGYFSLFDGRYLYVGSIFKSILLANIIFLIYVFYGKRKFVPIFLIIFIASFAFFNVMKVRSDMENEIVRGEMRKDILNQIQKAYPKLPEKVVFYTESDTAHYGLPIEEKIMPFFSGFGQTLLVWYEGHGQSFPACYHKDKYLYTITEEGYKECEGRGYGYFRKLDSLKETVRRYGIDHDNIISFRYISGEDELEDISLEIRRELSL